MLAVHALLLLILPSLWLSLLFLLLCCFLSFGNVIDKRGVFLRTVMPTASWSAKCPSPVKALVQRQLSNSTGKPAAKVSPAPRTKPVNGRSKGTVESAVPPSKVAQKHGTSNGSTPEKGTTVPRVVAAEMKSTVKKDFKHSTGIGTTGLHSEVHGTSKKELTRCSSTEGVLERKTYALKSSSRSNLSHGSTSSKSELKRCFSSEGILERRGCGQKNLSISRKSSGDNLHSLSDSPSQKNVNSRGNLSKDPAQKRVLSLSSSRVNKTVIRNTTVLSTKENKSKPKYISSGLKSTIEISGNCIENNPEVKSVIEISGNEIKDDPPEVPPLPSLESIGIPSKNLSTIIAVDFVTNHEDLDTHPSPAHASSTIQVLQDASEQPLSSTIIAVNYDVSTEINETSPKTLHAKTDFFTGKSSVWSKLQAKSEAQTPPSSNVAVNINIKQELEDDNDWNHYPPLPPPPVPPLPVALLEKHFGDQLPTPSVSPPLLPPRKRRTNNNTSSGAAPRGSKIPLKIPPSLTSLLDSDCFIVGSEEDRFNNSCTDEAKDQKKSDWDALFKKYEALEKECDSSSTTESEGIEMQHSSLTTIDSSEEDKKSCTEMLVTPLESSEDEKSCKNLTLTSVDNFKDTDCKLLASTPNVSICNSTAESFTDNTSTPHASKIPDSERNNSSDKFECISVVSDMPLIQPVTSISVQHCETLYKAKVAKVLAEEPSIKLKHEECDISKEVFDVSFVSKKHSETIQKSKVQVSPTPSCRSQDIKHEIRKTDCSPVPPMKTVQMSTEKEKSVLSLRPPCVSENISKNSQFAMTVAKFEQQKHSTEIVNKTNENVSLKLDKKLSGKLNSDTNVHKIAINMFDSGKEMITNKFQISEKLSNNDLSNCEQVVKSDRFLPNSISSTNICTTNLPVQSNQKEPLNQNENVCDEIADNCKGIETKYSKRLNSIFYENLQNQSEILKNNSYKCGMNENINSNNVNSTVQLMTKSPLELDISNRDVSLSSDFVVCTEKEELQMKTLPLISSVVRSEPNKQNSVEQHTDNSSYESSLVKSDQLSGLTHAARDEKGLDMSDLFSKKANEGCASVITISRMKLPANSEENINDPENHSHPKLCEKYLNAVENLKNKPLCANNTGHNQERFTVKDRISELNHSKLCDTDKAALSKFGMQIQKNKEKIDKKEKISNVERDLKKICDSPRVSSIINSFNLQKHVPENKDKMQGPKVSDLVSDKKYTHSSKKDCQKTSSYSGSTPSLLENDLARGINREEDVLPAGDPVLKSFQSSDKMFNINIETKLFPSLLRQARRNHDNTLPPGLIHLYHAGGYWTGSLPQDLNTRSESLKRGLYAVQSEPENQHFILQSEMARSSSLDDESVMGGIGVVRANTGRQLSDSRYRTELEIFFRSGVLAQLEAQRDERLTDHVIQLQANCRGYLARRKLAKIKVQDVAVRCIQRNVRKFLLVREWPWWRLLIKVLPLLNVHRTEEQLRLKTEELEHLRSKVESLEQERNQLKHDNDRLEAKLSEMTADLAEEHSTATLATERLEAEQSERLRLEKDLQDTQHQNKNLAQQGERLEMELLCLRAADMNGVLGSEEDDDDGEGDSGVYKQRYERAMRELEFTKRRLQQQHEDDLEQLVALKKQLEKKLTDAYEEVEEQRQVVAQWKRKVQKLNADTNDLHLLLEEQNSRNNLLEKKQRKFDSELQLLQDELRAERQQHERASREKEIAIAEKYNLEQNLSGIRLELELKEDRVNSLTQELDELMFGGKTEEEVAHLKKAKHELEKKLKEQEEELDDLAGQVQLLEQSKLRLEMSLEQQRKESRRELAQRDEELEDIRCNAQKKVKALEAQLESEHDERTQLVRERHELERRLAVLEEQCRTSRATEEDTLHRLRRDLRRTKALLRDAQTMLERARGESPGKVIIRQLRNQLEDVEIARAAAVKARQCAEMELAEVQAQLEEVQRARQEAEERASAAARERSELHSQLEENEEEVAEVLKKYRAAVQQLSVDQLALQEQAGRVAELESERASLREQLAELGSRLENMEILGDPSSSLAQKRLELRAKELESKLELEQTTRSRLEVQITRLKEAVEKLQDEVAGLRTKEQSALDASRRLQRQLREAKEEQAAVAVREAEGAHKRREVEKRLEAAEAEAAAARGDLRLALARIEDLQAAIQGELEEESSGSDPDRTESDHESDASDESINTFLANHKLRMNSSPRTARPSLDLDLSSRSVDMKKTMDASGKESFA